MRVQLRPLAPGEDDPEMLWAVVCSAGAVVGAVLLWAGWDLPGCLFFSVTGFPCLTCGGTRALREVLAGNLGSAFQLNPLVTLGLLGVALLDVYVAAARVLRWKRIRILPLGKAERWGCGCLVGVLVLANWAYVATHLPR